MWWVGECVWGVVVTGTSRQPGYVIPRTRWVGDLGGGGEGIGNWYLKAAGICDTKDQVGWKGSV